MRILCARLNSMNVGHYRASRLADSLAFSYNILLVDNALLYKVCTLQLCVRCSLYVYLVSITYFYIAFSLFVDLTRVVSE